MADVRVPGWYWVVAVLAVLWEAIGIFFFQMQVRMGPAELAALPKAQADLFAAMPGWQWGVFGVAVITGLLGALALLARSRMAKAALTISLIATVVQYGYTFVATPIFSTMSAGEALGLPVTIIVLGILLVWFASVAARKGWIR